MEGEDSSPQEPHLQLATKLFLLRLPHLSDIDKLRLKEDVFAFVNDDGNQLIPCLVSLS